MEKEKLIQIQWHVERSGEQTQYMLISQDPDYPDLKVSIGSDEVSERVAKARLIEKMFALGSEKGIPARLLRFRINGIEE